MGLVFQKFPGEWHGNKSISLVFSHLNKIFQPVADFEICLFGDETVYFDKVIKYGRLRRESPWLEQKQARFESLGEHQQDKVLLIDALFSPYLKQPRKQRFSALQDRFGSNWNNTVLVVVCARLGLKTIQPEYLHLLRAFFACPLNVGLLGGKPGEAYYIVGTQGEHVLFLDPHNTVEAVPYDQVGPNHMGYHESAVKRIHYTKLDASVGFCFVVRRESDFEKFKIFMQMGKQAHKENWIFNSMDRKPTSADISSRGSSMRGSNHSSFDCLDLDEAPAKIDSSSSGHSNKLTLSGKLSN
jgi:hypothetical protein